MKTSASALTIALGAALLTGSAAYAGDTVPYVAPGLRGYPDFYGRGILPPGPGYGWGFPNRNPDGYGWWCHGSFLPLSSNRTAEYYFQRQYAIPASQAMLPSYFNPVLTRGQRYVPYAGCGGDHPMGGPPTGSAMTPEHPYLNTLGTGPRVTIPTFSGRSEAPSVPAGGSGLTP